MLVLRFSKKASKFLEKCDNKLYRKIIDKIKELLVNPYPKDSSKVKGRKDNIQKIRIGGIRILYAVIKNNNELFIVDIDKRSRVYD